MIEAYKDMWVRAFDFKGVTSRASYWQAVVINGGLVILFIMMHEILFSLYIIAMIIPGTAVSWRRARSAGEDPLKVILLSFIPFVGGLINIYFMAKPDKVFEEEVVQPAPVIIQEPQTPAQAPSEPGELSKESRAVLGAMNGLAEEFSSSEWGDRDKR